MGSGCEKRHRRLMGGGAGLGRGAPCVGEVDRRDLAWMEGWIWDVHKIAVTVRKCSHLRSFLKYSLSFAAAP